MTVKELIEQLQTMPQDSIVILQRDAEGNGYGPLSCVNSDAVYHAYSTWGGDVYSTNWSADDACMGDEEWKEFKRDTPACVVLAPVN